MHRGTRSLIVKLIADHKCSLTMSIGGLSDVEKWERIWADASVVTAMCIRAGKMGSVSGLGRQILTEYGYI